MAFMKRIDAQDELQDGFEVGPLPPIGPDGGLQLPPMAKLATPCPRLCEVGPCRHYHRLEIQVDAADPMPIVRPDGEVVHLPGSFHVETHHYCYPDIGIEIVLGSLPVTKCNRFAPLLAGHAQNVREDASHAFWTSPDGVAYREKVRAWEAERAGERAEAQEAERLIAASLTIDTQSTDTEDE